MLTTATGVYVVKPTNWRQAVVSSQQGEFRSCHRTSHVDIIIQVTVDYRTIHGNWEGLKVGLLIDFQILVLVLYPPTVVWFPFLVTFDILLLLIYGTVHRSGEVTVLLYLLCFCVFSYFWFFSRPFKVSHQKTWEKILLLRNIHLFWIYKKRIWPFCLFFLGGPTFVHVFDYSERQLKMFPIFIRNSYQNILYLYCMITGV